MAISDTVDQMVGIIPVVITADVVMRFAERAFPRQEQQPIRRPARKKKDVYSRSYSGPTTGGNFSNIGW